MAVEVLGRDQAARLGVLSLGLDPSVIDLSSTEALSEVLRRSASFSCPTTERHLADVAFEVTCGLVDDSSLKERLHALLEEVINLGDLLELPASEGGSGRLIYLAQPAFVRRGGDRFLLLGVRGEGAPFLQDEVAEEVEAEGHARFLDLEAQPEPEEFLIEHGLQALSRDTWLRSPRGLPANEFVRQYDARLDAVATGIVELEGATILDTAARVSYYRGRWRAPAAADSGRFVGRRPQAYGSDLWVYLELSHGVVTRAIDLPVENNLARGCDEAWRLQAARDYLAGKPQAVRVERDAQGERSLVCMYSPLPSWAQRRLDLVGMPVQPRHGALMCYAVASDEVERELTALKELLWMAEDDYA